MKSARILTILVLAFGLMVCQVKVSEGAPMGTAFTYQGHLYDANYVANGLYDFQFKLYDSSSDGNQVGSDVNKLDVDVIDAYFTVELDFGSGVFDGDARWLEIGVRPGEMNDPNIYTTLSPRQEVTPTPYALQTRGLFVNDAGNVGIGTVSPGAKLEVNGDLKVTGAYKGNIGPNNGAPFPRPAYDSGWFEGTDENVTLLHNVGGDPNNYVVECLEDSTYQPYSDLTSNAITVIGTSSGTYYRVRIWVYN